jgi:putative DNA primase/helicase
MQAAADSKSPAAMDEAMKFLNEILAKGPVLKSEIEEAAEANGIADRTLRRAKTKLQVKADKDRSDPHSGWTWELPEAEPIRRSWNE